MAAKPGKKSPFIGPEMQIFCTKCGYYTGCIKCIEFKSESKLHTIFVNSVYPDQLAPGEEFNTIGQSPVLAHILAIFFLFITARRAGPRERHTDRH